MKIRPDSSGNVYVADTGNNRVQKFSSDGNYITEWGSAGSGNGQFNGLYRTTETSDTYLASLVYTQDR